MAHFKSKDDADRYLNKRAGGCYYYQRKVPSAMKDLDGRGATFRVSHKTKDLHQARLRRDQLEIADERYWAQLEAGVAGPNVDDHMAAVRTAAARGFDYRPAEDLAQNASLEELVKRISAMGDNAPVELERALLGGGKKPIMTVSRALELYIDTIASDQLVNKSDNQKRKWKNVKRRGVELFIKICGDLEMTEIRREHGLKYKEFWRPKIAPSEKGATRTHTASSGNRDLGAMRSLYDAYFEYIGEFDRPNPFSRLSFKDTGASKRRRQPFPVKHIREVIMKPGALARLNGQARAILLALVETGCRPSELANITKDAIHLNHEVPHITIKPRTDPENPRELKSEASERKIPLVGIALDVFRNYSDGFPRYQEKEEALSAALNKFLRANDLMPSAKHTIYGLRHSFEDRMKEAGIDEELRRIVMGHRISREQYGEGGSLHWRRDQLKKIALIYDPAIVTTSHG